MPDASHLRVSLEVTEANYAGAPGIARHAEPFSTGIPLPDSAGIKEPSQLGLEGASAGQFRVLGRWPSGNIQWVLVDSIADLSADKTNNHIFVVNGSGSFGGPSLASEDDSKITVSTGTGKFVIRKQLFDLIDEAVVNGRDLVQSGQSIGLALFGPPPGNTTCPCSTLYASSNDKSSTAVIEENGPVRAVIRATGQLKDSSGSAYMRFTVRMHFYKGKTRAKAVVLLQNADYGPSNSFASAYKGFQSFEIRLAPKLLAKRHFSFGAADSVDTGSFSGAEDAYLYQAYSDHLEFPQWSSPDIRNGPRSYIKRMLAEKSGSHRSWTYSQEGCKTKHSEQDLAKSGKSSPCAGWADLSDSTGAGIEIGVYEIAAYWPKSLEFRNGGSDVRIGIWPDQKLFGSGEQDYYQAWPQYSIHTVYLDFHDTAPPDPAAAFSASEHPLIAHAPTAYYNQTKTLIYPLVDPKREDDFFRSLNLACCAKDISAPQVYRTYGWRAPGSGNQAEMRWANLMLWLQRGHINRYIDASHFYTFQSEQVFPRSDYNGTEQFNWRDRPDSELDAFGMPKIVSVNANLGCDPGETSCGRDWIDNAHAHWYGMIDYYFLTGDETIKDAILDGVTDVYGNPNVKVVTNGTYWSARNIGEALMSDARLALFYKAIGEPKRAEDALLAGTKILKKQVWPELQLSGFGSDAQGVSRARGVQFGCCPNVNRFAMPFQEGILNEGLWEFLQAEGPKWPQHQLTLDLAYAISSWVLNETWRVNERGTGCQGGSGLAYEIFLDRLNPILAPSCVHTLWFNFYNYAQYTGDIQIWKDKFIAYLKHINGNGVFYGEIGTIFEGAVIGLMLDPPQTQLETVPLIASKQGNDYQLSWTAPLRTRSIHIKYSNKNIVEWLDFDPETGKFGKDPSTNTPWFAAADVSHPPVPASSEQTFIVSGLDPNVNWHFALKADVETGATK